MITGIIKPVRHIAAAMLLLGAGLLSCSSDGDETRLQGLELSQEGEVTVSAEGGIKSIVVGARSGWDTEFLENQESWLTLKKVSEQVFTVQAEPNSTAEDRSARLRVFLTDNSLSEELTFIQPRIVQRITLSPGSLPRVPAAGRSYEIAVSHTDKVNVSFHLEKNEGWIDLQSYEDGILKINILSNDSERRTDKIIFTDANRYAENVDFEITQSGEGDEDITDPTTYGYTLMSSMRADASLMNKEWNPVHSHMQTYGWDYTEHPNNNSNDHTSEPHMEVVWDEELGQHVFNIISHCNVRALDGDRGSPVGSNRMRNEMKSRTSSGWYHMNGNWGEWQVLEWKMKIPTGYQPSKDFCHIHQLKAQEGSNNGAPIITISLRANNDGSQRRMEVIHTGRENSTSRGKIVNSASRYALENFEGIWLQVQQEVYYARQGYYRILITRVSDGEVLMEHEVNGIDTWRDQGCINVRNKFGIYRSYGSTMADANDRPANGIKDENIWLADFKVFEKNSNNDNAVAVND